MVSRQHFKLGLLALALFIACGSAWGQNDPRFVIKIDGHYLAHTGSGSSAVITDAQSFNPATCLWYSGPNIEYNYYFIDEAGDYRYLSAPLETNGSLSLSDSHPGTMVLNQYSSGYRFYNWDHGVARGVQLSDLTDCEELYHGLNETGDQCWKVVWVSYEDGWKMSSQYSYEILPSAARFYQVSVTEHGFDILDTPAPTGGVPDIDDFAMTFGGGAHQLNGTATSFSCSYVPAYTTYVFDGQPHHYYNGSDHGNTPPGTQTLTNQLPTYAWTLTGEGAQYLSLSADNIANPTLTYHTENTTTSHKMATLTLTATYQGGVAQVRTATVTVKTVCQNPVQASSPVVTYSDVTLSWLPSADSYKVEWKKATETSWNFVEVGNVTSYTITGLPYGTSYQYRVTAKCGSAYLNPGDTYTFITLEEPGLFIFGAVYGGGRMADVDGNTEVLVIDCDSVGAVYGGNDIAGTVSGSSTIKLGVDASTDTNSDSYKYINGNASTRVRIFDVYGGGNGYYAYNGTSFEAASSDYNSESVAPHGQVIAMTQSGQMGEVAWTNEGETSVNLTFPKISNSIITVANDAVKVDSLFGGAKNAFLTAGNGNGSDITVNGGTVFAVFGGNNVGGTQGYGKHHVQVNNTKTNPTATSGFGRNFGIAYLFGGGNKVYGSTTEIFINGGQMDTIFAGGNSASVYAANLTVNCPIGEGTNLNGNTTFGNIYSQAIGSYDTGTGIKISENYNWNGTGVYNVRTLFGGNNKAQMTCLPQITLTSGSIGTVYGGGNAGDMMAQTSNGSITFDSGSGLDNFSFDYSTKLVMDSPNVLVDYLYGGCQMSNVGYSTWVQLQNGHVGTVYGGCNISGDVGSTRKDLTQPATNDNGLYQEVHGATYVEVSGGTVYGDVFAGSNGFYHCLDGYGTYIPGITYDLAGRSYVGMKVPTHNETHVVIRNGATINNGVYAGGNMAPVGFTNSYVESTPYAYPEYVGLASVRMIGGEVKGNVYGGGRMASINGSNEVRVTGGLIGTGSNGGALYGGNDRLGKAGGISNRRLPESYNTASDHFTRLVSDNPDENVNTYVSVTGNPYINTVYGGGNGAYTYSGPGADMQYCDVTDLPIQTNIFVDIAIDGGEGGGRIENVYGGGNGVYAEGFVKVFLNVQNCENDTRDHIGTIYGGNNIGPLSVLPDIILLNGNVNTVYGGCNQGAMTGNHMVDNTYGNIGSFVRLRNAYPGPDGPVTPTAKVTGAVYGGCRMNGVTNNSLVLVEGGSHTANIFGGSDISGAIGDSSHVIVTGGITGDVYGGGNGNYDYTAEGYQGLTAPTSATSQVDILGGQVGTPGNGNSRNIFGGGLGAGTQTTGNVAVNIGPATASSWEGLPVIYGDIYGGSALGSVNTGSSNTTTVNFLNGTLHGNVFGGGLGDSEDNTKGWTKGVVTVNISKEDQAADKCFIDLREASVFGCNNTNGSPQDNVTVNVYKTAYNFGDYQTGDKYKASYSGNDASYAINQVFGGGNEADYAPENGSNSSAKKATVNIFDCNNTVRQVFGGGNAAAAIGVATNVYGGRFDQVFGGGNGSGGAANIGSGGTDLMVSGGIIRQLFGGCNLNGTIAGDMRVNVTNSGDCDYNENITEFFGGSNEAPIGTEDSPANLVTTINCGANPVNINTVYGGSNLADITGDVSLNIYGGEYEYVYGGSKGQSGSTEADAADISGNVTLNLYGGKITNAFGGSNINGNIGGLITVNVLDHEADNCGLDLTNIYGASNQTAYAPQDGTVVSPLVNLMHIAQAPGIRGNVFGGGNLATVTANPKVNIGYVSDMASYLPQDFTDPSSSYPRAYVTGNVFGGGNEAAVHGNSKVMLQHASSRVDNLFGGGNKAGVNDSEVNVIAGTVATAVYGGCNESGTITGNIAVNVLGNLGATGDDAYSVNVFGGGLGHSTQSSGNVTVTIGSETGGSTSPLLYGNVYGGSAMGYVNSGDEDVTKVWLRSGTVNGRVFGGGLGRKAATGVDAIEAEVNGGVQVLVDDGEVTMAVYGCNDQNGAPQDTVNVRINGGVVKNVVGGGNLAAYTAPAGRNYPAIYICDGQVTHKVVGGGNAANVNGNPVVNVKGGTLCTGTPITDVGIYGGCNESGKVTGNITLNLLGGTIGTQSAIDAKTPVNVFGGGYGAATETTGDVTVNYGVDNNVASDYPKLYGDLYGGSALGHVNDNEGNDKTTVNVNNGSFVYLTELIGEDRKQYGGNIYGGGLGDATNEAKVYGEVHVNIGHATDPGDVSTYTGKANLYDCNVYGCNNTKGSPQKDVYVDVYQSLQFPGISTVSDNDYAIRNVFGGGNVANYLPAGTTNSNTQGYKTHVYVHGCNNTIDYVYGGGNAADAMGAITLIDGGHFNEVFGGGNGLVTAANIGLGGVCIQAFGGHVNYLYEGSNRQGVNHGMPSEVYSLYTDGAHPSGYVECGDLFVDSYFFGDNEAEHIGDLDNTITCAQASTFHYKNVYAGSRFAVIYGNVTLRVQGGEIENLYGGSRGYAQRAADIRRFPTQAEIDAAPEGYYSQKVLDTITANPSLMGTGGNINLIIEGGTIGNVYGGCHVHGNVEGKITVSIDDKNFESCPFFVGDVYGASDQTSYTPTYSPTTGTERFSPEVNVLNGTIGGEATFHMIGQSGSETTEEVIDFVGNVFGGGNRGEVTSSPVVTIGDNTSGSDKRATLLGNVYGGGNAAKVTGNTKVILQGNAEVKTNVYGGGKSADVDGNTKVILEE